MSDGTPVKARSVSFTVTRNVALIALVTSSLSVIWQVTVVVPIGKVEFSAGLHVIGPGVLSSSKFVKPL